MTRKQALIELRDKVKAGGGSNVIGWATRGYETGDLFSHRHKINAAYNGSLDAAKELHEAVLPTFVAKVRVGARGAGATQWSCEIEEWNTSEVFYGNNQPDEARAWLLAILSALIAQADE
jgi:hypothetical protein